MGDRACYCLQTDIVVAKTFSEMLNSQIENDDTCDMAKKKSLAAEIKVFTSDCEKMGRILAKRFCVFSDMEFQVFMDYYSYVFRANADGSYGLRVENIVDEQGNLDLDKFFVGMFIPNFYQEEVLQSLNFDVRDAFRETGPWAHISWSHFATQTTSIPGNSSLKLINDRNQSEASFFRGLREYSDGGRNGK